MSTYFLVYQGGMANVFDANRNCLLQASFRDCEMFARGIGAGGHNVRTMACNKPGDISALCWDTKLDDAPFSDAFRPVIIG